MKGEPSMYVQGDCFWGHCIMHCVQGLLVAALHYPCALWHMIGGTISVQGGLLQMIWGDKFFVPNMDGPGGGGGGGPSVV